MTNPLLDVSSLPFGFPNFSAIRAEDFVPAFDTAMQQHLSEVAAVAESTEPPTFENTYVALERSGTLLGRVMRVFWTLSSSAGNAQLDDIDTEMSPKFAEHYDEIHLNGRLFSRLDAVYRERQHMSLSTEDQYLIDRVHLEFVLAGAELDDEKQHRLRELNTELASLGTRFGQYLLADSNALAVRFTSVDDLEGLDAGGLSAAKSAAEQRGLDGYVIPLVSSTGHPVLSSLTRRSSRERIMHASLERGRRGGKHDIRDTVLEIVRMRAERASLLGFPNHAAVVLAEETAKTPAAVNEMLDTLTPLAIRNAEREALQLQQLIDSETAATGSEPFELESWDWAYYTERLRSTQTSLEESKLKSYFEINQVLQDGVFWTAHELYGISLVERHDLPLYDPDVRIFTVNDYDGETLGLFVFDPYARASKRGGAWMNDLSTRNGLLGGDTIVINTHNIPKPGGGEPTLLTLDEVETLFHEFGHALHGLFGITKYPRFSGTEVPRDFVEYPSQVNEIWMRTPVVLRHFARHVDTGEVIPEPWIEALCAQDAFNEGFMTTEYLAASVIDQAWHQLSVEDAQAVERVEAFEQQVFHQHGLDLRTVPPRYTSTTFQHIFENGYDAGYYSYIWSEVLDADTVEWFREHNGPNRESGQVFRDKLLGVGGGMDPLAAYRAFRGRDASMEPLLRRRGLK